MSLFLPPKKTHCREYRGTFFGRLPNYFSEINQNLAQAWAKAAVPTLAMHGEFDSQDISAENAQMIGMNCQ
ncbi:MAG: hypothetical protein R2822_14365 [Spirosomataceae bacterium]